jgi:hypothetical protein
VRYSREGADNCRDSLGDARVIFVIRPEAGCSDTGRHQHLRPRFWIAREALKGEG